MKVKEVARLLEDYAPLDLQEAYDNSGLQLGSAEDEVKGVLCTLDITQDVLDEAMALGANLVISHHPLIFTPLKSITGNNANEQILLKAIRNNINIYSAHTNLDNAYGGVNQTIAAKIGLMNCRVLNPLANFLYKLVTFVPADHAETVRDAIFAAGAGQIGNYDSCSFILAGTGTFRAGENTDPFVGEKGKLHTEDEVRIETVVPGNLKSRVVEAMLKVHPYEEVAFDLYPLANNYPSAGSGLMGELMKPMAVNEFLAFVRELFGIPVLRYAGVTHQKISKVAVCGGAGIFLLKPAIQLNADAFLTGDIKYHQFSQHEGKILICDIGHYESEQFTKEIFYNLLKEKISTFAVHLSKVITNPINYFS